MLDNDVESVSIAYKEACVKQNIAPIASVLDQIQVKYTLHSTYDDIYLPP